MFDRFLEEIIGCFEEVRLLVRHVVGGLGLFGEAFDVRQWEIDEGDEREEMVWDFGQSLDVAGSGDEGDAVAGLGYGDGKMVEGDQVAEG